MGALSQEQTFVAGLPDDRSIRFTALAIERAQKVPLERRQFFDLEPEMVQHPDRFHHPVVRPAVLLPAIVLIPVAGELRNLPQQP